MISHTSWRGSQDTRDGFIHHCFWLHPVGFKCCWERQKPPDSHTQSTKLRERSWMRVNFQVSFSSEEGECHQLSHFRGNHWSLVSTSSLRSHYWLAFSLSDGDHSCFLFGKLSWTHPYHWKTSRWAKSLKWFSSSVANVTNSLLKIGDSCMVRKPSSYQSRLLLEADLKHKSLIRLDTKRRLIQSCLNGAASQMLTNQTTSSLAQRLYQVVKLLPHVHYAQLLLWLLMHILCRAETLTCLKRGSPLTFKCLSSAACPLMWRESKRLNFLLHEMSNNSDS